MQLIRTIDELRRHTGTDVEDFVIVLNGGAYSRKGIAQTKDGKFSVFSYIDETERTYSGAELITKTNIGVAMARRSFYKMD